MSKFSSEATAVFMIACLFLCGHCEVPDVEDEGKLVFASVVSIRCLEEREASEFSLDFLGFAIKSSMLHCHEITAR
jgi:pyruvate-formate lyase-activating enzyme